ncbi:hypothetical protein SCG7109_AD_00390 [Chlamydiales bacterium SCGC AG-110-M15]|nr:hypothetical protein SCG7109_AD_00390 [Chlamydiales bacterium SCGC AG-110-M15]
MSPSIFATSLSGIALSFIGISPSLIILPLKGVKHIRSKKKAKGLKN